MNPSVTSHFGDALAQQARWQLRLLGDVVLRDAQGATHRLPGRAATALLARLALAPERGHAREALIDLLWPGVALDVGRNRLRQVLSTLKSLLEGPGQTQAVLRADRLSVRLEARALACDVPQFEARVRAGQLAEAAALYRGELLPGFYDEWIHDERLRLAALADALAALPMVAVQPAPPAALTMPAEAPARAAPPMAALALNLPRYITRLHGADEAGARLRSDAQTHRLVTLLGPGGHGKTRLAVEVAQALADGSAWAAQGSESAASPFDRVAFVPLVACQGAEAQPEALLNAVMLALRQDQPRAGTALDHLVGLLAGRRTLLVLDNFEQLVDACAPLVATLLARCAGLHLLVTSRRALGLDGEHERTLPPLPLPAPGALADEAAQAEAALNPAVALFVDRARAVRADFHLSSRNRAAVVALVRHLQGMPLAIELAATRVRSLAPAALLALLQAAPAPGAEAPGLALLARSGPRAAGDPRHASMLAVVQWSWGLVSPAAQRVLPRLSVFAGSFGLAAVQALGDEPMAETALALDELVAHSMLRTSAEGDRYELFELIREFAASIVPPGQAAVLRARQRRWLAGWLVALPLSTPLQRIRPEVPNLAAALHGAETDGAPEDAAALASAAQTAMSAISLPPAALAALARCADALADPVQRAVTRAGLARHLLVGGRAGLAGPLADQALAELPAAAACAHFGLLDGARPAPPGLARALVLTRVAHVRWRLYRDPAARAWLDEALGLAEAAGAPALQASILTNLGALLRPNDPAGGMVLQRRAITLWQAAGDVHGVNVGRCNLAMALAVGRSGCEEALQQLAPVLVDTRAAGDEVQHALAHNLRGEALSRLGRWAEAAAAYQACISTADAAAEPWPLVYGLWNLPRPWAHLRQPMPAARLMGFAERHAVAAIGPLSAADLHDLRRLRRLCVAQAPAGDVALARGEGAALDLAQAVRLALQAFPPH